MSVPDISRLRDSLRPAWLWDAARRRVAWANSAALAFFGEESLLDLVERPFDAREPGVAALAEAFGAAGSGEPHTLELDFPSAAEGPLKAEVFRHALSDGREGLLVVAAAPLPPERAGHPGLMREVLDAMPLPVAALDGAGALVYANPAALELFDEARLAGLSGLFGEPSAARAFLERAARAGMAVFTGPGETRLGRREIRLTARLTHAGGDEGKALFTIMIEDVTERRALERAMGEAFPPPPPSAETAEGPAAPEPPREEEPRKEELQREEPRKEEAPREEGRPSPPSAPASAGARLPLSGEDISAFRRLSEKPASRRQPPSAPAVPAPEEGSAAPADPARAGREADAGPKPAILKPAVPKPARSPAAAEKEEEKAGAGKEREEKRRERPETPALVRDVLDHRPEPILLHRDDVFYYANTAARGLFGFGEDDPAWDAFAARLAAAGEGDELSQEDEAGRTRRFRLKRDVFPWRDGAVIQSTLLMRGEEKEEKGEKEEEPASAASSRGAEGLSPREEKAPGAGPAPAAAPLPAASGGAAVARLVPASPAAGPRPRDDGGQTARRLSPEPLDDELRAILDTATDGIITLDRQGKILSFSAGAGALFGLSPAAAVGSAFMDLLDERSRAIVEDYLAAVAGGNAPSGLYAEGREVTARTADGGELPLFITIGRLGRREEPERANKASYCVVVRDITQYKKTEDELRQAKEEAERSSAMKSEFLASISHELRTPLNAILGFSDVMRHQRFGEMGNEKYLGYANDIHESGEHLLSLINDLLDLSRIEAGKFELSFEAVDLGAIAEDCINLMSNEAARARVVLRRAIPANLPRVVADARAMKQIFLNLLSNAVKFTDPGGQVMVSMRLNRKGELEAQIADTGCGMSAGELERALKPFERITGEGRPDRPGTGLGLPLTKALTEANRAVFRMTSEPGRGTTVRIIFPTPRVLAG